MKQITQRLALLLTMVGALFAQNLPSPNANWSLTATGTGNKVFADANYHTVEVVIVTASVCTMRLEGTIDGSNWFDLSGTQTCTSNLMFHVDGKPVAYVRPNLLTYTGDASGVKVYYWGTK